MIIHIAEPAGFSAAALTELRAFAEVRIASSEDRVGLLEAVSDADVLWVRLRHAIDREVMAAAPHLRIIVSPTTGLDHIDMDEANRRGIAVLSLRGETAFLENVRATSEHTLALLLALLRRIPAATVHTTRGGWDRDRFKGRELNGRTAGIIGYGRVGRHVAGYLRAFGMHVLAYDPRFHSEPARDGVEAVSLDELLGRADVISLHVLLAPETRHLFGPAQFAGLKEGAVLVNTSRGELVDETALLEALRSGRLGGAALDVIQGERGTFTSDHPLLAWAREHDNLIITPHLGGCTVESMAMTELFLAGRLRAAIDAGAAGSGVTAGLSA